MLQWAIRYAKLGLSVIPLNPKGKEPLYPWKEYQNRRATAEEIIKWWRAVPNANIGIVTGKISNLLAVDCDGEVGLQYALKLGLKSSIIAITGSGSKHFLFKYNGEEPTRIWKGQNLHEEVFLRSDGEYIVAAPSIHPNGKRYRWLKPLPANFASSLSPFSMEFMKVQKNATEHTVGKQDSWIAEAIKEMQNGHVHNNLVSVLGKFRHHNFSINDTYALLKPHALENGKPYGGLKDKIEEIWGRYAPAKTTFSVPTVHRDIEEDESVDEFLQEEEPTEWFSEGIFAKNSIGFFAGLPESGKTWALMDLAISAATGGNWLGLFPVTRAKTLFIDQERARPETKRRFESLFRAKGLKSSDLEYLRIKRGSSIKIDLEASYNAFTKLLEQRRPELVIIDSLATFHTKEGNNAMEIQSVMEKLKTLRDKFNCAFLFVHHLNKNEFAHAKEGQEPDIGLLAGSIAIPAAAETVFIVRKRLSGESTVYHCKSTMAKKINPFEFSVQDVPNGISVKGAK